MVEFANYSLVQLSSLRDEIQALAGPCPTLREAADVSMNRIHDEFSDSLVLARCYTTMPFGFLPDMETARARDFATEHDLAGKLTNDTSVIVLISTRGRKPEWNDRSKSRRRLAVPLLSPECLESIPLVGRVLGATVSNLPWLKRQETLILTETSGKMSHLILVEDAGTTVTSSGSKAVLDQDFVADNGVRSVIAMGGRYLNGASLVVVLFTTESLSQEQATKFPTIVNAMKTATMKVVMATSIL